MQPTTLGRTLRLLPLSAVTLASTLLVAFLYHPHSPTKIAQAKSNDYEHSAPINGYKRMQVWGGEEVEGREEGVRRCNGIWGRAAFGRFKRSTACAVWSLVSWVYHASSVNPDQETLRTLQQWLAYSTRGGGDCTSICPRCSPNRSTNGCYMTVFTARLTPRCRIITLSNSNGGMLVRVEKASLSYTHNTDQHISITTTGPFRTIIPL